PPHSRPRRYPLSPTTPPSRPRLLQTRHNDAALERIINLPARGIGEKTLETLRDFARAHELSLWGAIHQAIGVKALTGRAAGALNGFVELIDELALDRKSVA